MLLNVLGCQLTYWGQTETNVEAWFNVALCPRKLEGSLGWTAQDGHLDSHTAPELCGRKIVWSGKYSRSIVFRMFSLRLDLNDFREGFCQRQ